MWPLPLLIQPQLLPYPRCPVGSMRPAGAINGKMSLIHEGWTPGKAKMGVGLGRGTQLFRSAIANAASWDFQKALQAKALATQA